MCLMMKTLLRYTDFHFTFSVILAHSLSFVALVAILLNFANIISKSNTFFSSLVHVFFVFFLVCLFVCLLLFCFVLLLYSLFWSEM